MRDNHSEKENAKVEEPAGPLTSLREPLRYPTQRRGYGRPMNRDPVDHDETPDISYGRYERPRAQVQETPYDLH